MNVKRKEIQNKSEREIYISQHNSLSLSLSLFDSLEQFLFV